MVPRLRRASKAELAKARRKQSARMFMREQPSADCGVWRGGVGREPGKVGRGQIVQLSAVPTEPRSLEAYN